MLYDLNDPSEPFDTFELHGKRYELAETPDAVRARISAIPRDADPVSAWRPIIADLLALRHDRVPSLPDAAVSRLALFIIGRL